MHCFFCFFFFGGGHSTVSNWDKGNTHLLLLHLGLVWNGLTASINQISIVPISHMEPGSVVRQLSQCSTAKLMKQFHGINGLSGVPVSKDERPSQRDVFPDVSPR